MTIQALSVLRRAFRAPDQAIDFGTAFLRVAAGHNGPIVERRSAVATPMADRGRHVAAPRPALQRGVICDISVAVAVLEPVLRLLRGRLAPPRILVCVPSDATSLERAALADATMRSGASEVAIVAEPVAAAVGAGLPTGDSRAQLLVDIGDGVTDLAVIRSGEMIHRRSLRVACGDIRAALVEHVRTHHEIDLDVDQADRLVAASGGFPRGTRGRLNATGWRPDVSRPVEIVLAHDEILRVTESIEDAIVGFVAASFLDLPDELAVDVIETGAMVSGGGALLARLVAGIGGGTGLHAFAARDPLRATITGARAMLPVAARTGLWKA